MFSRQFVRTHITSIAIVIFLLLFYAIHYFKPEFIYDKNGALRPFGLGYANKTIIPAWLVAILVAILSYLFVLYYLAMPRLRF